MFKSRVAFAIIGAVLLGSVSGIIAGVAIMPQHPTQSVAIDATATIAPAATSTTQDDTPTAIPTKRATSTPRPTATASATPAPGQSADLTGRIGTIDSANKSFTFTPSNGSAITVQVSGSTQYQNVSGFSALRSGMRVEVKGIYQTSVTLNATLVRNIVDN